MNWNDDRLDRLADQVEALHQRIDDLRVHMDKRFREHEARMEARFDRLQNSLIITLGGILAAVIALPNVF